MEPIPPRAIRAQLMATRGNADVTLAKPLYIRMTNTSQKTIHEPKHTIMAWTMKPSDTIATTDNSLMDCVDSIQKDMPDKSLKGNQNIIAAVHYKPAVDRDTQMKRH